MKLIVSHDDLRRALSFVQSAVAKRPSLPICAHARLTIDGDRLALATTDLNSTALTSIDAEVLATSEGTTVNMESLSDVAKAASAPLTLHATKDRLAITTGTSKFDLPTRPVEDFPTLPEMTEVERVEFSASDLLGMLRACDYAMTEDETRFNLAGAAFVFEKKRLDVVATDGHRMAVIRLPGRYSAESFGAHAGDYNTSNTLCVVFAHEALVRATRKLSVTTDATTAVLVWNSRHVGFTLGADTLLHLSVDANFPSYGNSIPSDTDISVQVEAAALLAALRASNPFGAGTAKAVALTLTRGSLTLTSSNIECGTSSIRLAVDYSGPDFLVGFASRYFIEPLETIDTRFALLRFISRIGAETPMLLTPVDSSKSFEAKHVVMSIRLGK